MKVIRRTEELRNIKESNAANPHETYFFYDRKTGAAHFHVQAGSDGKLPLDQAAGLLAMHCMVRGQSPADYIVMVRVNHSELDELAIRAAKLLEAGQSAKSTVRLTRREEEVLDGVMHSRSNKEIAGTLNLSERTVKFHVSSLLAKYGVRGRMELVREASKNATPLAPMPAAPELPAKAIRPRIHDYRPAARPTVVPLPRSQQMMA